MDLKFVVALSVLCQLSAAILALRLIRLTGRQGAWIFISIGLFGMAIRRVIPLYGLYSGTPPSVMDPAFEFVGLVISVCMLAGVGWIGPLFQTIRDNQEKLRQSEARFRRIVDTANEGILFTDASGNVRYLNQRMADMVGWKPEEMQGHPITDFLPEGCECIRRMANAGRPDAPATARHDCRFRRKDGSEVWTMVSCGQLQDDAGGALGSLAMITDISERKGMEQEREDLIRELQDALANVKTLKGLLPICAWCNKVRDESGDWHPMEVYVKIHSDASFSHGICPDCRRKV